MLLVKTFLDKSPIHGLGVFAGQFIRKDTKIWRFVEGFDRFYSAKQFAKLPKPARDFIAQHGYRVDGEILLTADNDHHMNHSDAPNTYLRNGYAIAAATSARARRSPTITANSTRCCAPPSCARNSARGPRAGLDRDQRRSRRGALSY